MKMQDVLTKVQGKPITVEDVVNLLKINGTFRNTIYQLIEIEVINLHARARGISYTDEELEAISEEKRRMMGLGSAVAFNTYCRMNGVRQEHWKNAIVSELLKRKLKTVMVGPKEVDAFFQQNRDNLKMACLARIVVKTREEAESIKNRVSKEEADFSTLARQYSLENTSRIAGGYLGCYKKGSLPPEIDKAIFSSTAKSVVGPFSQNGYWSVYRIEEIMQAEISDVLRSQIIDKIFNQWLSTEVQNAKSG
ncbi:MAG: hypothetical protein G8345_07250 [Magnetococcales bacterium]|nr:peptidylprolyl isomerase [Magnetococcales bacterium]NGZ26669.1 hypothetical protein [Magnetococcales bacterium]